jgi:hypothetical protein
MNKHHNRVYLQLHTVNIHSFNDIHVLLEFLKQNKNKIKLGLKFTCTQFEDNFMNLDCTSNVLKKSVKLFLSRTDMSTDFWFKLRWLTT